MPWKRSLERTCRAPNVDVMVPSFASIPAAFSGMIVSAEPAAKAGRVGRPGRNRPRHPDDGAHVQRRAAGPGPGKCPTRAAPHGQQAR